tara:strand:- start:178 stop:357 length:180 start_codon:yes stop_codon:yes gene_type:complete
MYDTFILKPKKMFEYTHIVKDSKGAEWGAFQNASIAGLMQEALSKKFSPATRFYVEAIS